jgi:hypothetical protein
MGAIARKAGFALMAALAVFAIRAGEASDGLTVINRVATALAANDASEAMAQFDKSYPDYDKLQNYFIGLTGAYNITSEATVADEQDSPGVAKLMLDWTLTLTQPDSSLSKQRKAEIQVRVVRKNGKWKIAGFSPIEIFNPALSSP